jgi:GTP cyclohydrolase I
MSDKEAFTEHDWRRLLTTLGENPDRPGLIETPARVTKAWKHWTSGRIRWKCSRHLKTAPKNTTS